MKPEQMNQEMNKKQAALALIFMVFAATTAAAGELLNDIAGTKLRVQLVARKAQWAMGAAVEVDAVVTNLDEAPLRIDVFGGLNEVYQGKRKNSYIVSCWNLAWDPQARPASAQRGKAPLHVDQLVRLGPGESYTLPLSWEVKDVPPGRYRVRLAYTPRVASPSFNFPEHWLRQQGVKEPIWMGMIFSEPVEIEVVGPS